jgi:hypothetical protein
MFMFDVAGVEANKIIRRVENVMEKNSVLEYHLSRVVLGSLARHPVIIPS